MWIAPAAAFLAGGWVSWDNRRPSPEAPNQARLPGPPQIDCHGESPLAMDFTDWRTLEQSARNSDK